MNQTPELIFRKTNFVAAKHMKTFSFPKYFPEMLLHEPNTTLVYGPLSTHDTTPQSIK